MIYYRPGCTCSVPVFMAANREDRRLFARKGKKVARQRMHRDGCPLAPAPAYGVTQVRVRGRG